MVVLAILGTYVAGRAAYKNGVKSLENAGRHRRQQRVAKERQRERKQEHEERQRARQERKTQFQSMTAEQRLARYKKSLASEKFDTRCRENRPRCVF